LIPLSLSAEEALKAVKQFLNQDLVDLTLKHSGKMNSGYNYFQGRS